MNVRLWFPLLFACTILSAAPGVELVPGLVYQRFEQLPRELTALREALASPTSLVLDLRGVTIEPLSVNLRREVTSDKPDAPLRLVLVNETSSPVVLSQLPLARPHAVALAPRAAGTVADVAVEVTPEVDRRAVDDLAQGGSPRFHLPAPLVKEREDERSLARAHAGLPAPTPTPTPLATEAEKASVRIEDPVLTRAVQLFQAWQALREKTPLGEPKSVDKKDR